MDKDNLIQRYLSADTSFEEERELSAADPQIALLQEALKADPLPELPEAGEDFDRLIGEARKRKFRIWGLSLGGVAASVLLLAGIFLPRPAKVQENQEADPMELLWQLEFISMMDPADATNYEFKRVGDGYIMTARFEDGNTASFLLTPMDGGESFHLVSLAQ
ncbi:MAG: hypothetical protein IJ651_09695 [Bacteroidales bacterium]|nr:hypothetical protein [Bacteroidales bacterium]MBR1570989.1 hypothetical protein [Bacteroidales bacterium]